MKKVVKAAETLENLQISLYKYLVTLITKKKNGTMYKGTTFAIVKLYYSTVVQKYTSTFCNTIMLLHLYLLCGLFYFLVHFFLQNSNSFSNGTACYNMPSSCLRLWFYLCQSIFSLKLQIWYDQEVLLQGVSQEGKKFCILYEFENQMQLEVWGGGTVSLSMASVGNHRPDSMENLQD